MTLTRETAELCANALSRIQWAGRLNGPSTGPTCPECGRHPGNAPIHDNVCTIGIALAALRDDMAEPPKPNTPIQQARSMLGCKPGDNVTELEMNLADLIASHERLLAVCKAELIAIDDVGGECRCGYGIRAAIDNAWKPNDA